MKHILNISGILGLSSLVLSSFAGEAVNEKLQDPASQKHIKIVKIENGKKTELDTVLTGNNNFVWKGDTLNSSKIMRKLGPSGMDKHKRIDVDIDRKSGNEKVMILKHDGGKSPVIWRMDSDEDMEMFTSEQGDSLTERIIIRKKMMDGEANHMIFRNIPHGQHFPPMPPSRHMPMFRKSQSGRTIDLNDPNIISFKKKNLKGGKEKIEIIRNKSEESGNVTYDFDFNEDIKIPHAPNAPEIKFIEKKMEGAGKIEKKIETKIEKADSK